MSNMRQTSVYCEVQIIAIVTTPCNHIIYNIRREEIQRYFNCGKGKYIIRDCQFSKKQLQYITSYKEKKRRRIGVEQFKRERESSP